MSPDPAVQLRLAIPEDDAFIVEMARHASVIEDGGTVASLRDGSIVAVKAGGRRVGA